MYKHKDGWRVSWYDVGRRRTRKFGDKRLAERFELELKLGVADVGVSSAVFATFGEYAKAWLKDYCRVEKAESQWTHDQRMIELHLLPGWGDIKMRSLRKSHFLDLKAELRTKKQFGKQGTLSPKTVNNILSLAKRMMTVAVEREIIPMNPFAGTKLLKIPQQDFAYWTVAERDRFLEHAEISDPEFARLVAVAVRTGLRIGELAALQRKDLDFERKRIRVTASYSLQFKKRFPTKGKEVADVPMNREVIRTLEQKRFLLPTAQVFNNEALRRGSYPAKRLKVLAKEAGVSQIRFHDLRHTFASHLAMAGTDLMLIQKLMRHKTYQMTLRYAHLHPDSLEGSTDVLDGTRRAHAAVNE